MTGRVFVERDEGDRPEGGAGCRAESGGGNRVYTENRVEVPFAHVAPPEAERWSSETAGELRVPIGRTGATKLQYLAIGKGTKQHALFAGKTVSVMFERAAAELPN